ncbi:hypothetical protein HDU76_010622, partial [Blyttiomyces sp. JEL0837]
MEPTPYLQILVQVQPRWKPNVFLFRAFRHVIDDNLVNRKLAIKYLSKHGFIFDEAVNGSEAVKMAKRVQYDVILMDIDMPVMKGDEATRRIRIWEASSCQTNCSSTTTDSDIFNVPIIAVTSSVMEDQVLNYFQSGVQAVLAKPYLKDDLIRLVLQYANIEISLADHDTMAVKAWSGPIFHNKTVK